ncbi:FAD/FMN-containing dehydrogenase [Marmoricola sp. OAE513]|uniref:FAD-binding oxidoreductase n=1 Tax=Marmoricola sp. OAE513 TaxID=2817894 RepID=UPI001AE691CD
MTNTVHPVSTGHSVTRLKAACGDVVHLPGTPEYDRGRTPWNVGVGQRPAAVATPVTVDQAIRVVRTAAATGLRVTAQSTGHAASALAGHALDDVVLVRTGGLRGVHVDPVRRVARVEAGASWEDVVTAAAVHGLTAMHGSAPDIGVVGYTLGGGLSWFARQHGLAVESVLAVELVLADGELVRADASQNTELFWALRGGVAGNFGLVTTVELELLNVPDAFAGMLLFDVARAPEVLNTWATWCRTAPEEITTSFRVMRFPPIPELPPFLSGRAVVILDGVALLDDDAASAALAPLRDLGAEMDTFGRVPAAGLLRLHMDPEDPTPSVGRGAVVADLDAAAVESFLAAVGPGVETPVFMAELRQLGGALARTSETPGALTGIEGSHLCLLLSVTPTPEIAAACDQALEGVLAGLAPHLGERLFLNFAERSVDPRLAFEPAAWDRLVAVRREVDPTGLFLANFAIEG